MIIMEIIGRDAQSACLHAGTELCVKDAQFMGSPEFHSLREGVTPRPPILQRWKSLG